VNKSSQLDELVELSPKTLNWAIERAGVPFSKIEKVLRISRRDVSHPLPFDKIKELADVLHIPFGYLFLESPPKITVPLPDFRTKDSRHVKEPSLNLAQVLSDVLLQQDWYREYRRQYDDRELDFVGSFTCESSVQDVAAAIRDRLSLSKELREEAQSWSHYLTRLSQNIEEAGILVMRSGVVANDTKRKLSSGEFQGFAIADKLAPVVFVNTTDFKTAQIFTLAHELAHIWSGTSGISNPDPVDIEQKNRIEVFCNKVATEVLVPSNEFSKAWRTTDNLDTLARRFRVSTLVVLVRAYELNKISLPQFIELRADERKKQKDKGSSGGDYYRNVIARHGHLLTDAVISEVRHGTLMFKDAAALLGMKVPTLANWVKKYS
jgi:Zn-dependent peptidase ImmA (M78 family)